MSKNFNTLVNCHQYCPDRMVWFVKYVCGAPQFPLQSKVDLACDMLVHNALFFRTKCRICPQPVFFFVVWERDVVY